MEQPILDGLNAYRMKGAYPWHMPGHKQRLNTIFPEQVENPFLIDVTEVPGVDEFHHPEGIIKQAFDRTADIYGARHSYYLINGGTVGILAAIFAVCREGDSLIVARNCHMAVYHAIRLLKLQPVYVMPAWNEELGITGGISPEAVKRLLKQHSNVKAVVLVSPTYEGVTSDVEKISRLAHKYNVPLIVDAAHGAHFEYMANVNETISNTNYKNIPQAAIRLGADLVVESIHKTLPAMTQCALLHENSGLVDIKRLEEFLSVFQSTSPSYVFMASMEACIEKMDHERDGLFIVYKELLRQYRERFSGLKHIHLVEEADFKKYYGAGYDDGKLVFCVKNCMIKQPGSGQQVPFTGVMLGKMLEQEYGQMMEMTAENHVIAMTSVADTQEGFEALYQAVEAIDGQLTKMEQTADKIDNGEAELYSILPEKKIPLAVAKDSYTEEINLSDAKGKVSGDYIYAYPPGIPVVVPGEVFSDRMTEQLLRAVRNGIHVKGVTLEGGTCRVCVIGQDGHRKKKHRFW